METGYRTVEHLVDAEDRCVEVPAQAVQGGGHGEDLSGPLLPLSSLELTPEQSCQRIQHHQTDQTPGQQEGDTARQTQLERVLQVKASVSASSLWVTPRLANHAHQVGTVLNVHVVAEAERADERRGHVGAQGALL